MFHVGSTQVWRAVGAFSAVGFAFVLAVVIGAGAGLVLDRWLGTSPLFFLILFFMGVVAGMLNVFRMASRFLDDERRSRPGAPPA